MAEAAEIVHLEKDDDQPELVGYHVPNLCADACLYDTENALHFFAFMDELKRRLGFEVTAEIIRLFGSCESEGLLQVVEQIKELLSGHEDLLHAMCNFLHPLMRAEFITGVQNIFDRVEENYPNFYQPCRHLMQPAVEEPQASTSKITSTVGMMPIDSAARTGFQHQKVNLTASVMPTCSATIRTAYLQPLQQKAFTGASDSSVAAIAKYGSFRKLHFFEKVRAAIDSSDVFTNFKLFIYLYNKEYLTALELVDAVTPFLQSFPMLLQELRELTGVNDPDFVDEIPQNVANRRKVSPDVEMEIDYFTSKKLGASYRCLPPDNAKCSGRTALSNEVLNNTWAAFPAWSEETTFVPSRKTEHEETMFRLEEERFELDMAIQSNISTIKHLNVLQKTLDESPSHEKLSLTFDDTLDGNTVLHERNIKRIYGERISEVMGGLKKNPTIAVPIVLKRLKIREDEWIRAYKAYEDVWKNQTNKFHMKALDIQGINFKQTDNKNLKPKKLLAEIKGLFREKERKIAEKSIGGFPGPHITHLYMYNVLEDGIALLRKHCARQSSLHEEDRKNNELLLCYFIAQFFGMPHDFYYPNECENEKNIENQEKNEGATGSRSNKKPTLSRARREENQRTREQLLNKKESLRTNLSYNVIFVTNEWYLLLRLFYVLCDRLHVLKKESKKIEEQRAADASVLPSYDELGNISSAYDKLLRRLLIGKQELSEDDSRKLFGISGYLCLSLDRISISIVKLLHNINTDDTSRQCIQLYKKYVHLINVSEMAYYSTLEPYENNYLEEVQSEIGANNCYKVVWHKKDSALTIELMPSLIRTFIDPTELERWSTFMDSFVEYDQPAESDSEAVKSSSVILFRNWKRQMKLWEKNFAIVQRKKEAQIKNAQHVKEQTEKKSIQNKKRKRTGRKNDSSNSLQCSLGSSIKHGFKKTKKKSGSFTKCGLENTLNKIASSMKYGIKKTIKKSESSMQYCGKKITEEDDFSNNYGDKKTTTKAESSANCGVKKTTKKADSSNNPGVKKTTMTATSANYGVKKIMIASANCGIKKTTMTALSSVNCAVKKGTNKTDISNNRSIKKTTMTAESSVNCGVKKTTKKADISRCSSAKKTTLTAESSSNCGVKKTTTAESSTNCVIKKTTMIAEPSTKCGIKKITKTEPSITYVKKKPTTKSSTKKCSVKKTSTTLKSSMKCVKETLTTASSTKCGVKQTSMTTLSSAKCDVKKITKEMECYKKHGFEESKRLAQSAVNSDFKKTTVKTGSSTKTNTSSLNKNSQVDFCKQLRFIKNNDCMALDECCIPENVSPEDFVIVSSVDAEVNENISYSLSANNVLALPIGTQVIVTCEEQDKEIDDASISEPDYLSETDHISLIISDNVTEKQSANLPSNVEISGKNSKLADIKGGTTTLCMENLSNPSYSASILDGTNTNPVKSENISKRKSKKKKAIHLVDQTDKCSLNLHHRKHPKSLKGNSKLKSLNTKVAMKKKQNLLLNKNNSKLISPCTSNSILKFKNTDIEDTVSLKQSVKKKAILKKKVSKIRKISSSDKSKCVAEIDTSEICQKRILCDDFKNYCNEVSTSAIKQREMCTAVDQINEPRVYLQLAMESCVIRENTNCKIDPFTYRIRYVAGTGDFIYRLKSTKKAKEVHKKSCILQKEKFQKWHFSWMEKNVTQSMLKSCQDWFLRQDFEFTVDCVTVNESSKPPYGPYTKYLISRTVAIGSGQKAKRRRYH